MSTHATQQPDHHINSSQTNLVLIKCFMHEVLQMALCYLEAIHSKVPDLVQKEKMGEGVQGELDLLGKIVQGDLNAEKWRELSLDLVMADFIHMDAAVDIDSTEVDTMATVKVADSDDTPKCLIVHLPNIFLKSRFHPQQAQIAPSAKSCQEGQGAVWSLASSGATSFTHPVLTTHFLHH